MTQPTLVEISGKKFWRLDDDLYPDYLNNGGASLFIRHVAERYCRGRGADIGGGAWPFPGAQVIDQKTGGDAYRLPFGDRELDYVFSSHCLEHVVYPQQALREWTRVLKHQGIIFLYLPHPAMRLWHARSGAWVGDGHKWIPETQSIIAMLDAAGCDNVRNSDWPDAYWSFHAIGKKR